MITKNLATSNKNILDIPLDVLCTLVNYLNCHEFYHLFLALTSAFKKFEHENKLADETKKVITFQSSSFFKKLDTALNSYKKKLLVPGFFYIQNRGCFAWGLNNYGQLGLGNTFSQDTPQLILFFKKNNLRDIATGGYHSLFLTSDYKVYGCGNNLFYPLGSLKTDSQSNPELIVELENKKIIAIGAGRYYSHFLTDNHEVYGCGINLYGQLGTGDKNTVNSPKQIEALNDKQIRALTLGLNHSHFLSQNYQVWTCGCNNKGQLGLGHEKKTTSPQLIEALKDKKIIATAAGERHSLFLTDKYEVYSCGDNNRGQLGLGHKQAQNTPQLITALKNLKIIAIAAGDSHSLFLTHDHKIYSCGYNANGQLALKDNNDNQDTPQQITALGNKKIIAITAKSNSSQFLTDTYCLYTYGSYEGYQMNINNIPFLDNEDTHPTSKINI